MLDDYCTVVLLMDGIAWFDTNLLDVLSLLTLAVVLVDVDEDYRWTICL